MGGAVKLGICMDGVEAQFENALMEMAHAGQPFGYVEIGVAYCQTMAAVVEVLKATGAMWSAVGVDPAPFAREHFNRCMANEHPAAYLLNIDREAAFRRWSLPIDFCLIDGCHGPACVNGDFLSVEPHVKIGGLVIFHDFGTASVGQHQPHCQAPSNVCGAVETLGLLDGTRPCWKRLPDWIGDHSRNGADCGVFRRIGEDT